MFALLVFLTGCAAVTPATEPPTTETVSTTEVTTVATETTASTETTMATTDKTSAAPGTTAATSGKTKTTTVKTTAATTPAKPTEDTSMYTIRNLFGDPEFQDGFTVFSQKDHAHGDAYRALGDFYYTSSLEDPSWHLYQWDTGPCLWENRVASDKYTLTDGASKWLIYDKTQKSLTLRLNTASYYKGKGAVQGDYWPTFLIGQEDTMDYLKAKKADQIFYTGEAERWVLSFDVRMPVYKLTPNPDDWVEAAQMVMYFGIVPKNTHKYVWFGAQVFDNRWEHTQKYYIIDGGKDDATGLPIYVIPTDDVYNNSDFTLWVNGKPEANDTWIHVELDLLPFVDDMRKIAIRNGYYDAETTLSDLFLHGMNFGWESIGTFDSAVEIKNLHFDSWVSNEKL